MHAASVIVLSWAMTGAALFVSGWLAAVSAAILALLVAVVGLPHGAADHRFARPRLEPLFGNAWLVVFLIGYALVAATVVVGWLGAPAVTIVAFFLASAWHFGLEEPHFALGPRRLRPVFAFARGGLVIWTPLVFHDAEVNAILSLVAPGNPAPAIRQVVAVLQACAATMLAVSVVAWVLQALACVRSAGLRRRVLGTDTALIASLVTLFTVANPLVGFLVYFCGWHSVRGLRRLRLELGESWPSLAKSLAPATAGALALISLGAWFGHGGAEWNEIFIRATFMGLSAVAMPHLLLHGVSPLFEASVGARPPQPLPSGSPA